MREIKEFLSAHEYNGPFDDPVYANVSYWYRRIPGTNHQYVVKFWPPSGPSFEGGFEVESIYETQNGIWANTKYYGLSFKELSSNLERLEESLKNALLPMGANPLHNRFDGKY